jgi:hypothetical protein
VVKDGGRRVASPISDEGRVRAGSNRNLDRVGSYASMKEGPYDAQIQ